MATLYRKYRSKSFGEVIGQEPIVTTLKNQIKLGRIGHAYLFSGSRGIGKTSCARIFARAVNCLHPVDGEPCGKCEACKALEGDSVDIIELDAASNNGVDDARDIREKVKYAPVSCKYKIYIIDEAHMLTGGAFNALLKTIEEPPEHVIFILATTEPQKLPQTILSRCIRFDFRLVSPELLAGHIAKVYDSEGIKYTQDAVEEIARLGEGSVRDALSIADTIAAAAEVVTQQVVLELTGSGDSARIAELFDAIAQKDLCAALGVVDDFAKRGNSMSAVCRRLIDYSRNVLVAKSVGRSAAGGFINAGKAELSSVLAAAERYPMTELSRILEGLSAAENGLKYSVNPRVFLETALVKLICSAQEHDDLLKRIAALENNSAPAAEQKKNKVETPPVKPRNEQAPEPASRDHAPDPEPVAPPDYEPIPPPEPPAGPLDAPPERRIPPRPAQKTERTVADEGEFGKNSSTVVTGKTLLGRVAMALRRSGSKEMLRLHSLLARGVEVKERDDRISFVSPDSCFLQLSEDSAVAALGQILLSLDIKKPPSVERTEDDLFEEDRKKAVGLFGRASAVVTAA